MPISGALTYGWLILACFAWQCMPAPKSSEKVIQANLVGMETALNAGEMQEVAAYFAPEAIMIDRDGLIAANREQILTYWQQYPIQAGRWSFELIEVTESADRAHELADRHDIPDWRRYLQKVDTMPVYYALGQSTLLHQFGGESYPSSVLFIQIWQKKSHGNTRIVVDCFTRKE